MNNIKKIKITLNKGEADGLYVAVVKDTADFIAAGNSERLASAVAGELVVHNSNNRVYSTHNGAIASKLAAAAVDGWRLDGDYATARASLYNSQTAEGAKLWNGGVFEISHDDGGWHFVLMLKKGQRICKSCGAVITRAEQAGCFCKNCITNGDNGLGRRFGYHRYSGGYKMSEKDAAKCTKAPVFGCEIELDYKGGYNDFAECLTSASFMAVKQLYGAKLKSADVQREHVFMCDSSLRNDGCEWITFPRSLAWYRSNKTKLQAALETFQAFGFGDSASCGGHIHINRSFFGEPDQSKLAALKLGLLYSRFYEKLCSISGRSINNTYYCEKPTQRVNDSLFTLVEKTIDAKDNHCCAINQQHSATLELRLFGAVKSIDCLIVNLSIAQSLAFFVKKASVERCKSCTFAELFAKLDGESLAAIADRCKSAGDDATADELAALKSNGGAKNVYFNL